MTFDTRNLECLQNTKNETTKDTMTNQCTGTEKI